MKLKSLKGFSYVELMVTVTIIALMAAGGYAALSSGESSWFTAEAGIQVQESLRQALDQMTVELRQSKYSEVLVTDGLGLNSTDIIRFSVPVICHTGDSLLDVNGDVAHWGATTKWGCRDALCMDANNTCSSVEYKYIQYIVVSGNKLVRQVWRDTNTMVRQDTIANNISDFQIITAGPTLPVSLTLTAQVNSVLNRQITAVVQNNVDFRNK